MTDAIELVRELVTLPWPPGQEALVREAVAAHAGRLGCAFEADARGNLLLSLPGADSRRTSAPAFSFIRLL